MNYTISNDTLTAVISDTGAEIQSLSMDGHEYFWNGDPAFWAKHGPNLFPFVGRFTDGKYCLDGKTYEMEIHGFAPKSLFTVLDQSDSSITFELKDNEKTLSQYPFHFSFRVTYTLMKNTLEVLYSVLNESGDTMYLGLGAHPGFMVPMEDGLAFEDYYLEFSRPSRADQVEMSDTVFVTGHTHPYPLVDGTKIPLRHDLFDHDAVVLQNMPDTVAIRSDKGTRSVTVSYPGMPYIGFWHAVKKEAPYVCIEPWVTLPSRDGVIEDFANRSDLIRLQPGKVYENLWTVTLT